MAGMTPPRPPAVRLTVDGLEARLAPATLVTVADERAAALPADAQVLGASRDGRYFIFETTATDAVTGQIDVAGTPDLFWQDGVTGERLLVSAIRGTGGRAAGGVEPSRLTAPNPADVLLNAVISGDGQSVAFVSKRNALAFDGTVAAGKVLDSGNGSEDVFFFSAPARRAAQQVPLDAPPPLPDGLAFPGLPTTAEFVTLVSRDFADTEATGEASRATNPAVSDDGTFVAFVSNVFAADVDTAVVLDDNGDLTPDLFRATLAADGQFVSSTAVTVYGDDQAFGTFAGFLGVDPLGRYMTGDGAAFAVTSNLSPSLLDPAFAPTAAGVVNAYRIDLATDEITLLTGVPNNPGQSFNGVASGAVISRNSPDVVVFAAQGGSPLVAGFESKTKGGAELYARRVDAFDVRPAQLVTAAAQPAAVTPAVGADAPVELAPGSYAVAPDGDRVFFTSKATNLVAGLTDTNAAADVFARDLAADTTTALSTAPGGRRTGNGASRNPVPTDDGKAVAFTSDATDLAGVADRNAAPDVFFRDLGVPQVAALSTTPDGLGTANKGSVLAAVGGSATATFVYFNSPATDLSPAPGFGEAGQVLGYLAFGKLTPVALPVGVGLSGGASGFVGLAGTGPDGRLVVDRAPVAAFPGFFGEVRVAAGDVTGDGVADLVVGAGPGGGPRVRVLDGLTLLPVRDEFSFEPAFDGGVYVAAADFDGDGVADVAVGAGEGGGPRIRVTSGASGRLLADFFAFADPNFRGGVRVAAGDVDGDGVPDLVAAAGEGGGPRVTVYDGRSLAAPRVVADFYVFEPTLRDGVYAAAGDVTGDGRADLAVGAGPGGGPRVVVFDAAQVLDPLITGRVAALDFLAFEAGNRDGARVAVRNVTGDAQPEVVVGAGGGAPRVRVFTTGGGGTRGPSPQQPLLLADQLAFDDPLGQFGAYVG